MSALLVPATQESPLRTPRRKRTRTEARESVELQSPQPQAGPSRSSRNGSVNGRNLRDEGSDNERRRERKPEQGLDIDSFDMKPIENSRPNLNAIEAQRGMLDADLSTYKIQIKMITDVAVAAEDCRITGEKASEAESDKMFADLEQEVFNLIDLYRCIEIQSEVLAELSDKLQEESSLLDPGTFFTDEVVKRQEEYLARSQWAKCKRWRLYYIWHGLIGLQLLDRVSDLYRDFRTTVWNVNSEQACPPLSTFLAKGPDDEDDDDEIEMGGVTQTLKCPLTLLPFVDAHTSLPCRHSYSGAAIKEHILSTVPATNRKKQVPEVDREAKCPVAGCSHKLKLGDVRPDPDLQKRSDVAQRRLQMRQEEQDDARSAEAELIE